jgi:branched-chain amino acid aminotransferase
MPYFWLNGNFIDEADAAIPIRDTGLLHAAGVFTTMRSYAGRPFRLEQHLRRLRDSCDALQIPLKYSDANLADATSQLLQRNQLQDARLRLTITRGHARQDPLHGLQLEPNVFLTAAELEPYPAEYYQRGMTVILLDEQKLNPYDLQAGHKTLNYFSRLAALREANRRGAGEALWFNVHNYLQSASVANVFIVKNGELITPPTQAELREQAVRDATAYPRSNVLPGITRAAVNELAQRIGIPVHFGGIDVNALLEADEVFITNSIMQIMPVCRIERRAIGNDKPGPLTTQLSQAYADAVAQQGA